MNTQAEIPGQHLIQRCVIMQKDDKGYGLTVTGDNPVYVQSVKQDGAADRAGVRVGDKIVKVNGTLVTNSNHKEVVNLIKGGSYVALTLLGKPPSSSGSNHGNLSPHSPPGNSFSGLSSPTSPTYDERTKTIRRYLEQEQLFIKNIQGQYNRNPTPKLKTELAESSKRAKALDQELHALTAQKAGFLHLSDDSSLAEPVFDAPEQANSPNARHFSEKAGFYDNVQTVFSGNPTIVTSQPSNENLNDETPPKIAHLESIHIRQNSTPERSPSERNGSLSSSSKLRRKPGIYNKDSNRSKSLPGATHNRDIRRAVLEAEEDQNHNGSFDIKEVDDLNDSGLGSANPSSVMEGSQQQIVCMEDDEFHSEEEKCEDHGPFNDLRLLKNKPAHMAVFLHYLISNSDPTSLLFWIVTEGYEEGSAKDMRKWIYEIYSTFLVDGAPLKVEAEFMAEEIKKIEDSALGNQKCSEEVLRTLLKTIRSSAAKEASVFLSDFRAKRALGLGSLFGDHQLEDDNMDRNKEITVVEQTLLPHLDALVSEVETYTKNFEESRDIAGIWGQIFRSEALACAIATFMKQVGIVYKAGTPSTHVLEKCKTFMHKEVSSSFLRSAKKDKKKVIMQHTFHAIAYSSTTYCNLCRQLIWGIGHQGYQCQVCEYNVHRQRCLNAVDEVCTGKKKEKIVTKPAIERRSSNSTLRPSENGNDLLPSPDILKEDDKRKSLDSVAARQFSGSMDVPEQSIDRPISLFEPQVKGVNHSGKVNRSISVINKSEYARRNKRSKTEVISSSLFIPGVTRTASESGAFESEGEEEHDSDLEVSAEMPSIKETIDPKTYSGLKGKERKRLELINELIHTEKTHVRTLKVLNKVFYRPWIKGKIEYEHIRKLLFPNLDELIRIHKSLVEAMKDRQKNTVYVMEIGDLLLDRFDNQAGEEAKEVFAKFCQSQNYAFELLKVKQKKERKLDEFFQQCESNPLCRKLSLQGIISSSYQRLTKYPLFIEALIKATPGVHNDYQRLKNVLILCKQILEYVNQAVKEFEDQQRLIEFNKRIDKNINHKMMEEFKNLDLTKHKLIFDGPLTWRMNQTKNIDLHALLLEDLLVLLQKQDDKYVLKCQSMSMRGYQDNKTTHSPILKLSSVLTRNVATDKKAFFVVGTGSEVGPQIYELVAATLGERKNWFKFITEAIEVCKGKERGRRNALAMPATIKNPGEISEDEKQESEATVEIKEKDDEDKEKSDIDESEENVDLEKETTKDSNEEKERDSGESFEVSVKEKQLSNLTEKKRSRSVDDLKNEKSVDSPARDNSDAPVFGDGFDSDTTAEGFKKATPSPEEFSETSEGSSRSSVEIMELLKQKDEEIKKLLDEKSRLVEEIKGTPSTEGTATNEDSISDKALDARNLVVSSILEVNRLTGAVTSILNPSDRQGSQNADENPFPPQQQLAKSAAVLNEHLTTLLHVIADRDMNRERLRCDMQFANAQIQKLRQERNTRSCSNPSNSDETFLGSYDEQQGNWDAVNDRLAVPDNFNDINRPPRSSSFSGYSESSRSSRGSNRNSLVMSADLTDSCDV